MGMRPQSGEIAPESEDTPESSAPLHDEAVKLGPTLQDDELINKVYTGECITSFRQMLKRYNLHTCVGALNDSPIMLQLTMNAFPYLRGSVPGAIHNKTGGAPYNFCNTVMLHWVTNCFSGWRGSIRWKAVIRGADSLDGGSKTRMEVTRFTDQTTYSKRMSLWQSYTNENWAAYSTVCGTPGGGILTLLGRPSSCVLGSALTVGEVNPTLEWEIPFYSDGRHYGGKVADYTTYVPNGSHFSAWLTANNTSVVDFYCAAGEDYTPYFWTGCPVLYYEANPPVPL